MKIPDKLKRRWLIIPAAVGLLAMLVIAAGVVAAQTADDDSEVSDFSARVASILGLDAQDVEDARKQAWTEMREEKLQSTLDEKVASGEITQEQADEYKAWVESAPEGFHPGRFGKRGFKKGRHGKGRHGKFWRMDKDETSDDDSA